MPRKKSKKKDVFDKVIEILNKANRLRKPHKKAAAGVVAAILGGFIKAMALTETFPAPYDMYGNLILFAGFLLIVADIAQGGLYD